MQALFHELAVFNNLSLTALLKLNLGFILIDTAQEPDKYSLITWPHEPGDLVLLSPPAGWQPALIRQPPPVGRGISKIPFIPDIF